MWPVAVKKNTLADVAVSVRPPADYQKWSHVLMHKFKHGSGQGRMTIVDVRMKIAKVLRDREGVNNMQTLFKEMDTNEDGELDLQELTDGLKHFDVDLTDEEVALLFNYLDADHSGGINMEEFYAMQKNSLELHR
jgi:Ca2+-binding EF-hand superfamily protein